jgi:hypothetical protein
MNISIKRKWPCITYTILPPAIWLNLSPAVHCRSCMHGPFCSQLGAQQNWRSPPICSRTILGQLLWKFSKALRASLIHCFGSFMSYLTWCWVSSQHTLSPTSMQFLHFKNQIVGDSSQCVHTSGPWASALELSVKSSSLIIHSHGIHEPVSLSRFSDAAWHWFLLYPKNSSLSFATVAE